jgi:hypothetical protein
MAQKIWSKNKRIFNMAVGNILVNLKKEKTCMDSHSHTVYYTDIFNTTSAGLTTIQ